MDLQNLFLIAFMYCLLNQTFFELYDVQLIKPRSTFFLDTDQMDAVRLSIK